MRPTTLRSRLMLTAIAAGFLATPALAQMPPAPLPQGADVGMATEQGGEFGVDGPTGVETDSAQPDATMVPAPDTAPPATGQAEAPAPAPEAPAGAQPMPETQQAVPAPAEPAPTATPEPDLTRWVGAPVMSSDGVMLGEVQSISITPDGQAEVRFEIAPAFVEGSPLTAAVVTAPENIGESEIVLRITAPQFRGQIEEG